MSEPTAPGEQGGEDNTAAFQRYYLSPTPAPTPWWSRLAVWWRARRR